MADTVPGTTSSTVVVTVGTPLNGEIETAYEQDWYKVALTGGITYTIRLVGLGNGDRTLGDPLIDGIYTSGDTYVAGFNNDGLISGPYGRDAMFTYRPPGTTAVNYWIAAAGDLGSIGTFTISVTNSSGGTDNVAATTATTGAVTVDGAAVTGTIDAAAGTVPDVDWYKVALTAGTTYTIRMRGLPSANGTLADSVIAGVYNSSGSYIPNTYVDDLGTRDPALTLVAPYTGDYYIAAAGWTTYTGTFSLDVKVAAPDVAGNTATTATLAIGASTTVNMEQPYDHDWFGVTLAAGQTYQFSLTGSGTNNTPVIHGIFNSSGNYVGAYAAAILGPLSATVTTSFTPTAAGTYYIDAFSLYEGTFTLSAAQIASDVAATRFTTASVAVNGSVNGDIGGATDVDWYAVSLVADVPYVIKMRGMQSGLGTLVDPLIPGIYDAAGTVVANTFSDDSDGNEAALTFRPASSGTYYIAADGYAGYTGSYQLSVTSVAGDVGQTTATAASATLNTRTIVTIDDASDADWYAIALTAGTPYGIRLQGAPTKGGTLSDPVLLGLYDSAGTLIPDTFNDDARGLLNSIVSSFTPATSGTYYVAADGYDRYTGTMKLAVTSDYIGNTNALSESFTAGTPAEGVIDAAGDIDRYSIALDASSTYYIRMLGIQGRNGDLADPNISAVLTAAGAPVTTTAIADPVDPDDVVIGLDAWIKLTTTTAVTYYVVAEASGGSDGSFVLSADKDIVGGATTTATVPMGGSVTGFIDEATDTDWYSVALSTNTSYVIKMQGLDSGSGTLANPYINGIRLSSTPTTIISGTSGTGVDNAAARDSVARLIPAANGTYFINAQSSLSTIGSYTLSINTEAGNTVASAWTIAVGSSVIGTIDDTTDSDYYKVSLVANTGYVFKMLGVDSGAGTLDDPLISGIRNGSNTTQSGVTITAIGMDSSARWVPAASGDYYIETQGGGTDNGTFSLVAETEAGGTNASAIAVALGGSVFGAIDDGADIDRYFVTLNAATQYRVRLEGASSGNGTLINPYINGIRNVGGTLVGGTTQDGGGTGTDAYVTFTPAATGAYYIDADNSTTTPAIIGTYKLSVELWP